MGLKFKNNAFGILAAPITNVAVTIPLTAGHGARFPALGAGDYFYATLLDAAANLEIVKVTARAVDTLTVLRGQDGTAGRAYIAGDRLELRLCNAALLALAQESATFTAVAGSLAYSGVLDPIPTGYNTNQVYRIFFAAANTAASPTLSLNSLGAKTIKHLGGYTIAAGDIPAGLYAFLEYNGVDFILLNPWTQGDTFVAAGTDVYTVDLIPIPLGYRQDQVYRVKFANANTIAAPTLNFNGLGAKTIVLPDGVMALQPNFIAANMVGVLQYDGTNLRLLNPNNQQYLQTYISQSLPAGCMIGFGGAASPIGWLECDGSAVLRAANVALFAAIGTVWGAGDTTTTFNLPDYRGKTLIGRGTGTVVRAGVDTDVDIVADTLAVPTNTSRWFTGMPVVLTISAGTITPLVTATTYYVIRASDVAIKLATTLANAQNGVAIDITALSVFPLAVWSITHTYTTRTLGEYGGEETHAQTSAELLAHTHISTNVAQRTGHDDLIDGTSATASANDGNWTNVVTNSFGGNVAMNNMQPFAAAMIIIRQ